MEPRQEPIQVMLEIEPAAEPIRGAVRTDGVAWPFDGWMQLTAALEDARIRGGRRTDETPGTEERSATEAPRRGARR